MSDTYDRTIDQLRTHWKKFLIGNQLHDSGDVVLTDILEHYTEPNRYYHGVSHILDLLIKLERTRGEMPTWFHNKEQNMAVECALWDHDIIYDARRKDNEYQSSTIAYAHAQRLGMPQKAATRVHLLVRATKHTDMQAEVDAQIVCDLDLSSLASPWQTFMKNSHAIRAEYREAVPDNATFAAGRRNFFRKMLDERPSIYQTPHFRAKLEEAARSNLHRAIAKL